MPGASPGARIALPFRKVKRGEPHGHQAVCARVEEPRLGETAVSGLPLGQIAGGALVRDGRDRAVTVSRRCGCAGSWQADGWYCWRRAGDSSANLTGLRAALAPSAASTASARMKSFAPKPPPI